MERSIEPRSEVATRHSLVQSIMVLRSFDTGGGGFYFCSSREMKHGDEKASMMDMVSFCFRP